MKKREFRPGQRVLVLLPTSTRKLLTQGPFEEICRVGPVDYEGHRPGHQWERQIYHINLLQNWHKPKGWTMYMEGEVEDLGPQGPRS